MTRPRLDMVQESQLWEMALEHLGSDGLLQAVIEMWSRASAQTVGRAPVHQSGESGRHEHTENCPAAGRCHRARSNA